MFSYEEKEYLLTLLHKEKRRSLFKRPPKLHDRLTEKLEQMLRNERVNSTHLKSRL